MMIEAENAQIVAALFERWHRSLLRYALQVPLTHEIAEGILYNKRFYSSFKPCDREDMLNIQRLGLFAF
jgi:hypothetical protein